MPAFSYVVALQSPTVYAAPQSVSEGQPVEQTEESKGDLSDMGPVMRAQMIRRERQRRREVSIVDMDP